MDLTVAYLAGYILYGMKLKNNIVKEGNIFIIFSQKSHLAFG